MAKIVKNKPRFAPILTVKKNNFEAVFKMLMTVIISQNKIQIDEMRIINKELVKWLITGMQNIDFNDIGNKTALNNLVDDLWSDFNRNLNLKVRKHRTKFRRKQF